jgi:hypothetical protein
MDVLAALAQEVQRVAVVVREQSVSIALIQQLLVLAV